MGQVVARKVRASRRRKPRAGRKSNKAFSKIASAAASRPIVFAGPTIGAADVLTFVPDADVRRPVRRGDLESIPSGSLVAIIDGVFDAELAVSTREIRQALARGVRIVGSSSMGALRAAEVPQMIGVGRVYEMYRSGKVVRDDEVAVLLDIESGRSLTEPLVNVRFAVNRLVATTTLPAAHGEAIVEAASALHFHDRTYRNILRRARIATEDVDKLVLSLKSIDLKREDAMSLLEQLGELGDSPRWKGRRPKAEKKREVRDELDEVRIESDAPADAPVLIWEYGEQIEFTTLLDFIALTGRLDYYARGAILRFLLDDGEIPHPRKMSRDEVPRAQHLLEATWDDWGWGTPEEVHVTLRDLGFGMNQLNEGLREESEARLRLASLYKSRPPAFLRALRFQLLIDDLALKREAMRLGALLALARDADGTATTDERAEAKRALLSAANREMWIGDWNELLQRHMTDESSASKIVETLALARRRGVALLDPPKAVPTPKSYPALESLPVAKYLAGTTRSISDAAGLAEATRLGRAIGVTRVAQLSELDRIGDLHVAAAYRLSPWSSSIGSGKSQHADGAAVGALMEEVETYCQEQFATNAPLMRSYESWAARDAIDPRELGLPFDTTYRPDRVMPWTATRDLVTGKNVFVPAAFVEMRRRPGDPLFSARGARRVFSTNGLASGFTLTEALVHALCELIERHAVKLAEQETQNPGRLPGATVPSFSFVDLASCPESTQRICEGVRAGDRDIRVMEITSDIGVPTFEAKIARPSSAIGIEDSVARGFCTHPNAEIAINRAILEAVQTILVNLSGAREDLTLRVRSLGRHERPHPDSLGARDWQQPWVPKRSFDSIETFIAEDGRHDLAFILNRLEAASYDRVLYSDLSRPETSPAAVVRAFIPGTEGINPFHTGARARACMVRDLMRRHEW